MPQLDLDGANSKISADTIRGQSGTTVTVQSGHNLVGSGSGLTALPAANITGTLPAISGVSLTSLNASNLGSGTVPDARFPATLPAVSGANLTGISSGLTKLASTAITTGTAAIIFNNTVVTAYDNYYILLNGIKVSTAAGSGAVMFSTDNGSTFIGRTRFTARYEDLSAGTGGSNHTGTFSLNSVTNPVMWDNHTTEGLCGHFNFYNCNPSTDNTFSVHCIYQSTYTNQNDIEYHQTGAVMYDVTAGQQINYFKIVNATQNIDEGRATLYGFSQ